MNNNYSHDRYNLLLGEIFTNIQQLSRDKGAEYSGDFDRLANFRRNAEALGLRMEQVWAVYAAKHWDAIMTYVKDLPAGVLRKRSEPIEGRVDDLITYLVLFRAMLDETSGTIRSGVNIQGNSISAEDTPQYGR